MELGTWNLELEIWNLEPGARNLELGAYKTCTILSWMLRPSRTCLISSKFLARFEVNPKFCEGSLKVSQILRDLQKEGSHIVLKGPFSNELIDALSPLLSGGNRLFINDEWIEIRGKLTLVSQPNINLDFVTKSIAINTDLDQKLNLLTATQKSRLLEKYDPISKHGFKRRSEQLDLILALKFGLGIY